MTIKKIEMWQTDDGTLHASQEEAELYVLDNIREVFDDVLVKALVVTGICTMSQLYKVILKLTPTYFDSQVLVEKLSRVAEFTKEQP